MILISIYPEYVTKIRQGIKKYEFRKNFHKKRKNKMLKEKYIAVYESAPKSAITLIFKIGTIYEDTTARLWQKFGAHSGVTKDYFMGYYQGKDKGFAIEIKSFLALKKPIPLANIQKDYPHFIPPQNFYQLSEEKYPLLYKRLRQEIVKTKF